MFSIIWHLIKKDIETGEHNLEDMICDHENSDNGSEDEDWTS